MELLETVYRAMPEHDTDSRPRGPSAAEVRANALRHVQRDPEGLLQEYTQRFGAILDYVQFEIQFRIFQRLPKQIDVAGIVLHKKDSNHLTRHRPLLLSQLEA